jgi:AmiR/NasT family two-component response regulator
VTVFHPDDQDGEELIQQLRRIGCQAQAFWPPFPTLPEAADVVFLAVRPNMAMPDWSACRERNSPAIIAVVTYENPTVVEAVLKVGVESVIASPIKAFGLLATLVVARQVNDNVRTLLKRNQRLETKLAGLRQVEEAKSILMKAKNISEEHAYQVMREQAMAKRVTVEQIASAIIDAEGILSFNMH